MLTDPFAVALIAVSPLLSRPVGRDIPGDAVLAGNLQSDELPDALQMTGQAVGLVEVAGVGVRKPHAEPAVAFHVTVGVAGEASRRVVGLRTEKGIDSFLSAGVADQHLEGLAAAGAQGYRDRADDLGGRDPFVEYQLQSGLVFGQVLLVLSEAAAGVGAQRACRWPC